MTRRADAKPTLINLPLEIRDWLDKRAADEDRTLTALVSRALRNAMAEDQRKAG